MPILNAEQQAVVDFGEFCPDESLIVDARAGTGKTTTLLQLVSKLSGVTWFCAFGNRIAGEIESRVSTMPEIDQDRVRISTVHAGGNRIWRRHIGRGYKPEKYKIRNIVDDIGKRNMLYHYSKWRICRMVELAKQSGFGVLCGLDDQAAWEHLIDHFGLDVEADMETGDRNWEPLIEAAVNVYEISLKQCRDGIVDFSDMLLAPLYYRATFPQYDNILIDEAQDISPLRLKLIMQCLRVGGRVFAVGDQFQSIFGFTGSDDQSMDTIQRTTKADTLPMTMSYRCPKTSVRLAEKHMPGLRSHPDAIEGTHVQVAMADAASLQELTFWDLALFCANDVVLCRNNQPIVRLAHMMLRRKIPCYVEGRDVGDSLVKLIHRWPEAKNLTQLEYKVEEWREEEVAKFLAVKQNYKAEYVEDQATTLLTLMDLVRAEGGISVRAVLEMISGMFRDTINGKPDCITLSTVHKAKGKEWDRVFILGRDKYMPSKWARQEWEKRQESNLIGVALTRNIKELIDIRVGKEFDRQRRRA